MLRSPTKVCDLFCLQLGQILETPRLGYEAFSSTVPLTWISAFEAFLLPGDYIVVIVIILLGLVVSVQSGTQMISSEYAYA